MDQYILTKNEFLEIGLRNIPDASASRAGIAGEGRNIFKYRLHSWQKIDAYYYLVWELVKS